jgi:hypothetical protein
LFWPDSSSFSLSPPLTISSFPFSLRLQFSSFFFSLIVAAAIEQVAAWIDGKGMEAAVRCAGTHGGEVEAPWALHFSLISSSLLFFSFLICRFGCSWARQ